MYNRYIPQPDGSFRKSRMQEPQQPVPPKRQPPPPPKSESPQPSPPPPCKSTPKKHPEKQSPTPNRQSEGITSFFKNLLPKDLDTGDLMIILLLLLMAGDCEDDKNTALLTLALYFFM